MKNTHHAIRPSTLAAMLLALFIGLLSSPATAGRLDNTVDVNGLERHYIAHIPLGAESMGEISVVFAFHGGGDYNYRFEYQALLHYEPAAQNFIIVYPQGYENTWNAGSCCGKAMSHNIDEVAFVEAVLDDLAQYANIHPSRNFATGHSNGGMLSHRLACELPDRIAAVAAVAGTRKMDDCEPSQPVSVMHLHGLSDDYVPYYGGVGKFWWTGYHESVPDVVSRWKQIGECTSSEEILLMEQILCDRSASCNGGETVTSCAIPDLGHVWPGLPLNKRQEQRWGPSRSELPASREILDFFSSID